MLLCSIILAVVSGCDTRFKPETVLSQYLTDLNRSAFLSLTATAKVMPSSLPTPRYRQQVLTQFDIGLLDFLSLQQCDVGVVAGQKNSILGKVMPDSQRFLYELDIIRAIESCEIDEIALSKELAAVAEIKREELPKALGNAVFNGAESEAFFSLSNGFIPLAFTTAEQQELLSSLTRLVDIGRNMGRLPQVSPDVFEEDLKVLMNSEYAGRLLYSLAQLTRYLEQVGKSISALDTQVCGAPMTYLKQQFEVHYVQSIQPYMGRINQSAYQVLPLLNQLANDSSPLSNDMARFLSQFSLTQSDSVWGRYQAASQYHASQWNDLFGRCAVSIHRSD